MNELERITEVLDGMDLPDWVVSLSAELTYDTDGERAVAICAIVEDRVIDRSPPDRPRSMFRVDVIDALRTAGIELYPFVRFVAESEAHLLP